MMVPEEAAAAENEKARAAFPQRAVVGAEALLAEVAATERAIAIEIR